MDLRGLSYLLPTQTIYIETQLESCSSQGYEFTGLMELPSSLDHLE